MDVELFGKYSASKRSHFVLCELCWYMVCLVFWSAQQNKQHILCICPGGITWISVFRHREKLKKKKKSNWQQHKGKQVMPCCTYARCKLCKQWPYWHTRGSKPDPQRDGECLPAGTVIGFVCAVSVFQGWLLGPALRLEAILAGAAICCLSGCDPVPQDQALCAASVWCIKAAALVWPQPILLALLEGSKMGTTKMGWWAAGTGESTCVTSSLPPPILLEWAENHNQWRHFRIWHRMWLLTKSFFS